MSEPVFNRGLDGKTLVLQAVDIVQLIGQTVSLKKRGRSYLGLCPFHNEKTPSFNVHPDRGFFKCFGCNAAGNAIDFVIKRDRVEFGEALRTLADQYNVELPKTGGGNAKSDTGLRQALLDACSAAAGVFQQNLQSPGGAASREYLKSRGFNDDTIKQFKIGLATNAWDGLLRHPAMAKFKPDLLLQAGLLKAKDGDEARRYDTFRDRLMFPISDEQGRVIAFGGRVTATNDSPAKYLNSPETPLFLKSKVAYGLDLARQRIVETKTVAIVEGYTDVVMAHQFGASNVVATLGTAMTEQHITLLRRFADRIVLLFDGDEAGENAVDRALSIFLSQPIEIAIATLPGGRRPGRIPARARPRSVRRFACQSRRRDDVPVAAALPSNRRERERPHRPHGRDRAVSAAARDRPAGECRRDAMGIAAGQGQQIHRNPGRGIEPAVENEIFGRDDIYVVHRDRSTLDRRDIVPPL